MAFLAQPLRWYSSYVSSSIHVGYLTIEHGDNTIWLVCKKQEDITRQRRSFPFVWGIKLDTRHGLVATKRVGVWFCDVLMVITQVVCRFMGWKGIVVDTAATKLYERTYTVPGIAPCTLNFTIVVNIEAIT